MKKVLSVVRGGEPHWVGDGFPVRTIFHYEGVGRELAPFLLLDHAGPADFEPTDRQRGVGWHPHRGFETVTVVYDGEVDHEDSGGNQGSIGPGDVQWMTAGSGVLHKELHGRDYARRGGKFEMLQLWVNLPAKSKMTAPNYQTLLARNIPTVELPEEAGAVRVIAGEFRGAKGPARTFTPINLFDVRLRGGHRLQLDLHDGYTAALFILQGRVVVNGEESADQNELVVFRREGDTVSIEAIADATLLILNGQPIDEPIVGYGPFVMNTREQIQQAIADMRTGRLGKVPASTA
ncbi:MAG TPA: pirin family protein [Burkholderiales bacterium]|nr:pirin family protein [Burkholderiales bacterium]